MLALKDIAYKCKEQPERTLYTTLAVLSLVGWLWGVVPILYTENASFILAMMALYAIPVGIMLIALVLTHVIKIKPKIRENMRQDFLLMILVPGIILSLFATTAFCLIAISACAIWMMTYMRD